MSITKKIAIVSLISMLVLKIIWSDPVVSSVSGVFSHGGSDGTSATIDPQKKLIILVFTQTRGGGKWMALFQKMVNASILK